MSKRHYASICAIIKNEADLEEWIIYHRLLGFDHIYIYDNRSDISIRPMTDRYDYVTVKDWPMRPPETQVRAYNDFLYHYGHQTEWVAFIDADEFMNLAKHQNIKAFLEEYKEYDSIGLRWKNFGSNGHEKRQSLVTEAYTKSMAATNFKTDCRYLKRIVKARKLVRADVHTQVLLPGCRDVDVLKREIYGDFAHETSETAKDYEIAVINHYFTRSMEDWHIRMVRRNANGYQHDMSNFNDRQTYANEVEDRGMIEKGWVEKIKALLPVERMKLVELEALAPETLITGEDNFDMKSLIEAIGYNWTTIGRLLSRYNVEGHWDHVQLQTVLKILQKFEPSRNKELKIGEIGFNAGHSTTIFLETYPHAQMTSFDLGRNPYVYRCHDHIKITYRQRSGLVIGDSTETIPKHNEEGVFDIFLIDGGHIHPVPELDLKNVKRLMKPNHLLIMDDICSAPYGIDPRKAWNKAIEEGLVEELGRMTWNNDTLGIAWGHYVMEEDLTIKM